MENKAGLLENKAGLLGNKAGLSANKGGLSIKTSRKWPFLRVKKSEKQLKSGSKTALKMA